ncbi:MAG: iron-containing alcohol dehydrogenase [Bacteroidota bacterium]
MADKRRSYSFPTRIEYGPGAMKDFTFIVKESGLKKGLIVTDAGIEKVGTAQELKNYFSEVEIDSVIFSDVKSNPTEENVLAGTKLYKQSGCDFIVALGGGSPIDTGKTIKVMATHDGPLEKYDDMKGGDKYIKNNMPPFYAIPTTAGTGSEVGRSSVITVKNRKTIIFSPFMMPDIAVLDPLITVSLPPKLTAATGVDAFVHNLEAYIMETYHPMADGMAKEAMGMCVKNLGIAVNTGSNIVARGNMLMASAMGAIAFQKGLGVNHSIAHALGVYYDMHHGLANAVVLTEVMRYNLSNDSTREKYASLGTIFGTENDAGKVIEAVEEWLKSVGMSKNLSELGVGADRLEEMENYAMEDPCCPLNPKKVEKGDVMTILKKLI